jgi:hypothetical protein
MIRHGEPPYLECSSKGDRRFSAFYAMVRGQSIERRYQMAKEFDKPVAFKERKGAKPNNIEYCHKLYSSLWDEYITNNPHLLRVLKKASGLSDIFGQKGHCCQATELWRIRNEFQ